MMDRIERIRQSFITPKITQNDTHDYIQHHDPDYLKDQDHPQTDWADHDEDMTDISIESLIIFLDGLKKERDLPPQDSAKKIDQGMQKAIQAYTHDQPHVQKRYTYLDDDQSDIDLDLVDRLIEALHGLVDDGIVHITLLPAEGFLQSIELTVEKIRAV